MINQTIFQPTSVAGADGWTETGAPAVNTQPPNRTLPAPIFDDGNAYSPHNGAVGDWAISKTVVSDVAGPGFLYIPPGSYPSSGGIYADDVVAAIRVNGVAVPFTGVGTGTVPSQSVPVTWLAGNNTVEIEVANTIAGNTSLTGRLMALGAGVPCDCCPSGGPRCALVPVLFSGVSQTVSAPGWNPVDLPATIDGVTNTTALSGYNSPGGAAVDPTPQVTYTVAAQNRVRGLRLWNQGGGVLSDADGLGVFTADFYAGVTLLTSFTTAGVNGGTPSTLLLPGGQELNGVDRVVLRSLRKQTTSSVAPLWRELQLLEVQPVFPCRRASGAIEWYTPDGVPVPATDVVGC